MFSIYIRSCLLIIPALIEGARTILSENRSSVSEVDIKEKVLIMLDKKLHKSYTKRTTCLETIVFIGVLRKVITEWE